MKTILSAAASAHIDRALEDVEAETQKALHASLLKHLRTFKADDPATLAFVVRALTANGYTAETLAEQVGVSRPTVGRWAEADNIPRAPGYRAWLVTTLVEFVAPATAQRPHPPRSKGRVSARHL
jgi:hypothetical protein